MSVSKVVIKYKDPRWSKGLRMVLEDFKKTINNIIDEIGDAASQDYRVKVGIEGTPDYLHLDYFTRTIADHITIKHSYTASTGLTGGGTLAADRTFALSHLGLEDLTDPGADKIYFWDNSASASKWLEPGSFLTISGTDINVDYKDEDDMASDSATHLATQQSIKAYVDSAGMIWAIVFGGM